jgi:hypothetical protein
MLPFSAIDSKGSLILYFVAMDQDYSSDAQGLEAAFFTKENAQLLAQQQEKNQCEAFREVV